MRRSFSFFCRSSFAVRTASCCLALAVASGCNEETKLSPTPAPIATSVSSASAADSGAPSPAVDETDAAAVASATASASASSTSPDAGAAARDAGAIRDAGRTPATDASVSPPRDASTTAASAADAGSVAVGDASVDASAAPKPGSANAVAAAVDAIFATRKTFSARFKQDHVQKITGITKSSSGTVIVQKPDKVSFRYDAPNGNRIVSDGSEIKVYVAEDHAMYVTPVSRSEYPGAMAFIMGRGLVPSFEFTFNEKAAWNGGPVLQGAPRQPSPTYETVFFYIDKVLLEKRDPGVVRRVLLLDAQQNRNRFDFEQVTFPESVDPAEFIFNPPAGTDVKR